MRPFLAAAFALSLLAPIAARADDLLANDLPVVNVNREIGIAATAMIQNYTEHDGAGNTLDTQSGTLPGLEGKITTMVDALGISNLYAGVRYGYSGGSFGYNGATIGGTPLHSNSNDSINNVSVELGKGFLFSPNLMLIPFIQGGYHDWQSDLQGPGGYNEDHSNGFLGFGVRGDYALNTRLVLTGRLGWAETVGGSANASGGALAAEGYGPMNFALGDTPLLQAGIGADYLLANRIHLYGGLDYTHFG